MQTRWEDGDSREVYRQLLRSPVLRGMISTARMHPGARAMVVNIDQVPPPEEQKPASANVFTVSLTNHRFLITARELEIVYDMTSADYMLDGHGRKGMLRHIRHDQDGDDNASHHVAHGQGGQEGEAPQGGDTNCSGVEDCEFPAGGKL